jgi:hypothetical protein
LALDHARDDTRSTLKNESGTFVFQGIDTSGEGDVD